ncbi:MAG: glycyl-radical enzyme activating protein [Calditrichaceae bacterium]|nr:glycyl-radical enzyme activating protein [Calditrichaceae bacterium]RQV95796.1 MAG: glycyl-radical enzyme activating protein [Calditrichota bacterium]
MRNIKERQILVSKGTIFDIKKFAVHDGPGIRTTIFFKGCPLDCWWCHNPEGRHTGIEKLPIQENRNRSSITANKNAETSGKEITLTEIMRDIEKDLIFYEESQGGVTFSGGEPLMQIDFLTSLLKNCHSNGIHTLVDTCGYASWSCFESILPYTDMFYYDLKLIDDAEHIKYTGVSNKTILSNLEKLVQHDQRITIRIPLIPGITDTDKNLKEIVKLLKKMNNIQSIMLLPYNKLGEDKYRRFGLPLRTGKLLAYDNGNLEAIKKRFDALNLNISIESGHHE